jgi:hypothetical protein
MKIEVGKYYRTRDGRKVGPMLDETGDFGSDHKDGDLNVHVWKVDGTDWHPGHIDRTHMDLIAEWTEDDDLNAICDERQDGPFVREPETGTLAELDVKPGDVVEFVRGSGFFHPDYTKRYGGTKSVVGELGGTKIRDDGSQGWSSNCNHIFRIISRASDTPKTWGEMTDAEKGELLLADHEGKVIQWEYPPNPSGWGKPSRQNLWQEVFAYRIKPEPVRETVTLYGYVQIDGHGAQFDNCWVTSSTNTHRITFTTTDGKPDLDSIKMEALG